MLADHIVVDGADLQNGLLHVGLKRVVPEALKPRRIAIGTSRTGRRSRSIANDSAAPCRQGRLIAKRQGAGRPAPFSATARKTLSAAPAMVLLAPIASARAISARNSAM